MLPGQDGLHIAELHPAERADDVYEGRFGLNSQFNGKKYLPNREKLAYAEEIVAHFDTNSDGHLNTQELKYMAEGAWRTTDTQGMSLDDAVKFCSAECDCDPDFGYSPELLARAFRYQHEEQLKGFLAQVRGGVHGTNYADSGCDKGSAPVYQYMMTNKVCYPREDKGKMTADMFTITGGSLAWSSWANLPKDGSVGVCATGTGIPAVVPNIPAGQCLALGAAGSQQKFDILTIKPKPPANTKHTGTPVSTCTSPATTAVPTTKAAGSAVATTQAATGTGTDTGTGRKVTITQIGDGFAWKMASATVGVVALGDWPDITLQEGDVVTWTGRTGTSHWHAIFGPQQI